MVMLRIDMKQQLLHLWFLKMLDQAQSSIDLNQEMEWLKMRRVFEKLEAMKILLMIKLNVLNLLRRNLMWNDSYDGENKSRMSLFMWSWRIICFGAWIPRIIVSF